ncbi:phage tail terminator family protein [Longirhabdus pacifica]|uniref:phage tail terminator family protein n=1 Tax=Longirhabdus pacifica TaxID=2305227 RepID=UPI001008F505|nr:hypothetical protein [Longirhabdus pacifica]
MILNRMVDAIKEKLAVDFGDEMKIYTEDIPQGLTEPCFFITVLSSSQRRMKKLQYDRQQALAIQYIPYGNMKNKDMYDTVDTLYDTLEMLVIDGKGFTASKMNHKTENDVLHFLVDYHVQVQKEEAEQTPMEQVEWNNVVNSK